MGIDDVAMAVLRRLVADSVEGSSLLSGKLQPMRLLEERSAQGHNVLLRTDPYPYQAVYWEDIYNLLLTAFKEAGGVVHFGSKAVGTEQAEDCRGEFSGKAVTVSFEDGSSTSGDVLIAADGPRSRIYADSFPDTQPMKYLGYAAFRGTCHRSKLPAALQSSLQTDLPDLGNCLYFVMGSNSHAVVYELGGGLLNWLVYLNTASPVFADSLVTTGTPPADLLRHLHSQDFGSSIGQLIKATPDPFVNDIYDRDPLDSLVHGRIVLLGDCAHPITPHIAKGTNLAIHDAHVLSQALQMHVMQPPQDATAGVASSPGSSGDQCQQLTDALQQYERQRLPEVSRMVLLSRHKGLVRNCLSEASAHVEDFSSVSAEEYAAMVTSAALDTDTLPLDPMLRSLLDTS